MNNENNFRQELEEIQAKLADPNVYSTPEYPSLAKRQNFLEAILQDFEIKDKLTRQLSQAEELSSGGDEMAELARGEIVELNSQLEAVNMRLGEALLPKDPNDERNCVIEIRAAAGGDEASLFAGELYKMYARYCELNSFKLELVNESPSEAGGYKEISFIVRGDSTYGTFKFEAGVHRVQRVPVTESQGRIHTSTVTVAVLPEAEETDIVINANDLRVDVFRSGGNGGQSVNTTDSAVRITHLPTGLVVICQDEKSQLKNKAKALGVLRSRLLQQKIDEEQQKLSASRKKLIGSGDRSEKIRTYNYPQDRITDHRIGYSRSNIPAALSGEIQDLIDELHAAETNALSSDE